MKMSNRHLFLSTLHTNICSLYTKKFLKKFCKNTWLFAAPCDIIKGWGVGGTSVPYIFFWSEPSLLLYHILKQKSIEIVKIFLKNFSKNTWLSGAKRGIIKGGEVFFFFFFFFYWSQLAQLPAPSSDTPGCVAPARRARLLPVPSWSLLGANKCSVWYTWVRCLSLLYIKKVKSFFKSC